MLRSIRYATQARVVPAILFLVPALAVVVAWIPHALEVSFGAYSSVAALVATALLSQLGRDRGKKIEPGLWESWGGAPTTRMLRHRDGTVDATTKNRYHATLRRLSPDLSMPTPANEQNDPKQADQVYESCVELLKAKTRIGPGSDIILAENVNYGFRRNCLGLRFAALWTCAVSAGLCLIRTIVETSAADQVRVIAPIATLACLALIAFWYYIVTSDWVRIPAEAYGRRLLESCDRLAPGT